MVLACVENRKIEQELKKDAKARYTQARQDCAEAMQKAGDRASLQDAIRRWQNQEDNRRELVDRKAGVLFGTGGLAAALTTFVGGTVVGATRGASGSLYASLALIAGAILYLAMVLICAAKAQLLRAFYATSATTVVEWLSKQGEELAATEAAEIFAATKLNEEVIRQKTNWLWAGQQSFINAVILLFASTVMLFAHAVCDC